MRIILEENPASLTNVILLIDCTKSWFIDSIKNCKLVSLKIIVVNYIFLSKKSFGIVLSPTVKGATSQYLSYFDNGQNHLKNEGNLKIILNMAGKKQGW